MRFPIHIILSFLIASVSATLASSPPSATSSANPSSAAGKYPDKNEITKLFNAFSQGNYTVFFSRVAPDVNWTMMGTHPLAGQYHNRTIFIADTLERLKNTLRSSPPATMKLVHVVGGGSEWSVQELHGLGVGKNGKLPLSFCIDNVWWGKKTEESKVNNLRCDI